MIGLGLSGWRPDRGRRWIRGHATVFAVASASALAVEWIADADWPLFWPILIWAVALAVHHFLANALDVDEAWVEERAADLRSRSYDFDHIRDIEKRIDEGDDSMSPHAERERHHPDGA